MEKNNDEDKILDIKIKSIEFNESELKEQMLSLDKKRDRVWIMLTLFSSFVFIQLKKHDLNIIFNSFFNILFLILTIFYFVNIIIIFLYTYKYEQVENSPCLSKDQIFPEISKNKDILIFKDKFKSLSYFKRFTINLKYEIADDKIKRNNTKSAYIKIMQKIVFFHFFLSLTIIFIGEFYVR